MKYHDNSTVASDSISLSLDLKKLKFLMPEIFSLVQKIKYSLRKFGVKSYIEQISEHIQFGDSQGAVVINISPLLIAAYNEDIDCIVMLKFEKKIQDKYQFAIGDKLICVNTFGKSKNFQKDLIPGTKNSGLWTIVHPIIAELVSVDIDLINKRKNQIGESGYEYIYKLATEYVTKKPNIFRNGKPFYSSTTQ